MAAASSLLKLVCVPLPTSAANVPLPAFAAARRASRRNKYKLIQHNCCYDLRKFNFTNRVIPIWNSLSNHVVSADTVNRFKNRLDKFWSNQEVLHNHKADLHVTGNRSILE